MKNKSILVALLGMTVMLQACTEPGETTGIGAAAGGIAGAGLGAIVGSATGDAGGGLVIGAAAGSATGAAIGNVMQSQEEAIAAQDEAIERQEQVIGAQRKELEELRRLSQDNMAFREPSVTARPGYVPSSPAAYQRVEPYRAQAVAPSTTAIETPRGAYDWKKESERNTRVESEVRERSIGITGATTGSTLAGERTVLQEPAAEELRYPGAATASLSPECQDAEREVSQAQAAADISDRLFHYRRALRLCPSEASFHNGLGEVYVALGRQVDAEFEFQQALSLNPNYAPAQSNLNRLR